MDPWSVYWKSGICTSFGDRPPQWYTRALQPLWESGFTKLPDHSRILDVASGNGAVAQIAARVSIEQEKQFRVVAADKARLAPDIDAGYSGQIEFLPNTSLEKMRFPGMKFDLVTSQFGLEYAQADSALKSVADALEAKGELLMVVHHSSSIICEHSRKELQQYRLLLKEYRIFSGLSALLRAMGEIHDRKDLRQLANSPASEKQRLAFNRIVAKAMGKCPEGVVLADILNRINPLFREEVTKPLPVKLQYVQHLEQEMKSAQQRLFDLVNAALDRKGMRRFLRLAKNNGFDTKLCEEVSDEAGLLAWVIRLRKSN